MANYIYFTILIHALFEESFYMKRPVEEILRMFVGLACTNYSKACQNFTKFSTNIEKPVQTIIKPVKTIVKPVQLYLGLYKKKYNFLTLYN